MEKVRVHSITVPMYLPPFVTRLPLAFSICEALDIFLLRLLISS